ncbi:GGDEF and EAL domain-containing protein [Sphingomonas sp. Mn802worker]|uniref:GGDEF and EAL domain-containing protein n=1 Tax=Sphingomonas sp. Mn802worker TaxID=629773 RepID=UPI000364F0B5|nr:GGDEF and EAL domain-containing protein [Sphingomonas sp. Mn802worker]
MPSSLNAADTLVPHQAHNSAVAPARILDLLPGLVAYFGPDLRYRYANQTYARWRGMDPDKIVGRYVREIVGERNYPLIADQLRRALGGETISYDYLLFDNDDQRSVQGSYVPDFDEIGHVAGVIVLVTETCRRDTIDFETARSEAMFAEAFENAPFGRAIVSPDGRIVRVNPRFAAMIERPAQDLLGLGISDITHPDDLESDLRQLNEILAGVRNGYSMEKRYVRPNGTAFSARLEVSAVRNDSGQVTCFFAHVEDITQQREAERRLIEMNARLSLVSEAVRGGSWHMDVASGTFETSQQLARFVAGPEAQPYDLDGFSEHILPEDRAKADLSDLIEGKHDRSSVEYRLQTASGIHWMRCDRRLLRDEHGRPEKLVGVTIDLTEEHERRIRAELEATTDPLTGLLNRRGLDQRLAALPADLACGVMLVDLDGFKQVNDTLGHDAGDAILVEVGDRLRGSVRRDDLVARLGGDEFAVVLVGADIGKLESLAARTVTVLQGRFDACGDSGLDVGASIGAAWSASPLVTQRAVMTRADRALYQAKAAGRGTWRLAA